MLLGCAAFTAMYALVHELRQTCDWEVIAVFRAGLAFVFALGLAFAWGAKIAIWRPPALWLRSIAGSISLLCGFFAMTRNVPVSNVLAISNVFPIWVALLAWPMLGIRPTVSILLSVVTAVAGVFLIRTPDFGGAGPLFDLQDEATLATMCALMASLCTAVAMLGLNRLAWIDARAVVAHFSGVSLLFCLGAIVVSNPRQSTAVLTENKTLAMLFGVGITATAGQICLTKAFTIGAPAKVSVVGLSQIVMTLLVDICFFGEKFTPLNLLGIALVMTPTAWVVVSKGLKARPVDEAPNTDGTWELQPPSSDATSTT
jgi:drug/metabolite transporter (DMT)-like permease